MLVLRVSGALALAWAMLWPAISHAQQATVQAPQSMTATYQDWVMRCEIQHGGEKLCEIAQGIQAQGQQGLIAQIVVGKPASTAPFRLIVQLPAGVWLPGGVNLQLGGNAPPLALTYTRCQNACFADLELKPAQIEQLKARTAAGLLEFQDGARKTIQLPVSFRGFSAALEASQKG